MYVNRAVFPEADATKLGSIFVLTTKTSERNDKYTDCCAPNNTKNEIIHRLDRFIASMSEQRDQIQDRDRELEQGYTQIMERHAHFDRVHLGRFCKDAREISNDIDLINGEAFLS